MSDEVSLTLFFLLVGNLDSPTKTPTGESIPISPASSGSSASPSKKDALFEPSINMMVNDFDDERTLEEEEALAAKEQEDPNDELSDLQKVIFDLLQNANFFRKAKISDFFQESDMPIEELLARYNFAPPPTTSTFTYRKRKRRNESKTSSSKKEKIAEKTKSEETESETGTHSKVDNEIEKVSDAALVSGPSETDQNEVEDFEEETTTTNNPESNDLEENDDDTTNYDEEPSELCKLYTENYDKKGTG